MSKGLAAAAESKGATVASLREDAIELMSEAVRLYGNAAASAGVDFFDDVMYSQGLDLKASMPTGIYTTAELTKIAKYQAGKLRSNDVNGFVTQVSNSLAGLVYHGGDRTMMWQSGLYGKTSNPSKTYGYLLYKSSRSASVLSGSYQVRYARVPQGAETCDFCLMLASRGFVYLTADSAEGWNHTHRGCDCIVVPGIGHQSGSKTYTGSGTFDYSDDWGWVQDTTLEGYDLDAMQTLYAEWSAITKEDGPGQLSDEAIARKLAAMQRIMGRTVW